MSRTIEPPSFAIHPTTTNTIGNPTPVNAVDLTSNNPSQGTPFEDETLKEDREKLSSIDTAASKKAESSSIFKILYERGVNLMRPEIIATTEFVPLSSSGALAENDTPISMAYGEEKSLQVNQITRLIELHRAVSLAVQKTSSDFINKVAIPEYLDTFDSVSRRIAFFGQFVNEEEGEHGSDMPAKYSLITVDHVMTYLRLYFKYIHSEHVVWKPAGLQPTVNKFLKVLKDHDILSLEEEESMEFHGVSKEVPWTMRI